MLDMSQDREPSILISFFDEGETFLVRKMVAIVGETGALRNDLILRQLSSISSNHDVLFLHSKMHFPVERFRQIAGMEERKLNRVRLLWIPNFLIQERVILLSEMLVVKDNIRYLFFDSPVDNYIDSLSENWNRTSAIKNTHHSFIKQLATLRAICLERGTGVLLTFNPDADRMAVQRYVLRIWSDLVLNIEQTEPTMGRIYLKENGLEKPKEACDVIIKKEGPILKRGARPR